LLLAELLLLYLLKSGIFVVLRNGDSKLVVGACSDKLIVLLMVRTHTGLEILSGLEKERRGRCNKRVVEQSAIEKLGARTQAGLDK